MPWPALATGWLYDRFGHRILFILPAMAALVPVFSFTENVAPVIAGALLWGAALGIQESTLRATVADLTPIHRRATAYGVFAVVMGAGSLAGGVLAGALYEVSTSILTAATIAIQGLAAVVLALTGTRQRAGHWHSS